MQKLVGVLFLIAVLPTLLAAPGDKGVCSSNCENAGASCVIDMERKSASCGECKAGTTIFASCYQPNGECDEMCEKRGASCEVGRDPRVAECGKCKKPDGSDLAVEDQCHLVPNGRCDTECGNALAPCSPSLTTVPSSCGSCPPGMPPKTACREDYGRCSTKCGNANRNCKPDMRQVPRECGTCKEDVTPAEACALPPDGVCSDQCSRARAPCTQAQPGSTIMPASCGSCFVNAQEACLPIQDKCRISMTDSAGSEIVPVRIDSGNTAVYDKQGKAGQTLRFDVVVVAAAKDASCGHDMSSRQPSVRIIEPAGVNAQSRVTPKKSGAIDGDAYTIAIQVPGTNGGRYKIAVKTCCGEMQVMVQTPGGSSCIAWGDPHIITFDQMHYSYQGEGDYDMIKVQPGSAGAAQSDLNVQVRYVAMYDLQFDRNSQGAVERKSNFGGGRGGGGGDASTVKAIAAKEGDMHVAAYIYHYATSGRALSSLYVVVKKPSDNTVRTIDVRTMTGSVVPLIDGEPEHGTLKISRSDATIDFAKTGTQIQFNSFSSTSSMSANVAVRASSALYGTPKSIRGLCGDLDGSAADDLHDKNTDSVTASEAAGGGGFGGFGGIFGGGGGRGGFDMGGTCDTCVKLADTWRVTNAADSLFDYDNSIPGVREADLPRDPLMLPSINDVNVMSRSKTQQTKDVRMQAEDDPFAAIDPAVVEQANDACKMLSPPFATEADKNNCINDFIIASTLAGNTEAAQASIASIVNVHAKACEAAEGEDSEQCKAAGAGCEDLNGCNNMGKCVDGRCECIVGRVGDDCSIPAACDKETSCGKHGKCVLATSGSRTYDCECDPGFGGDVCEYVITADGKVLKLAGGTSGNTPAPDNQQDSFSASKKEDVSTGTLAAIVIVFVLLAVGIIGGVIFCRKRSQAQASAAKATARLAPSASSASTNQRSSPRGSKLVASSGVRSSDTNIELGTMHYARSLAPPRGSQSQRGSSSTQAPVRNYA